MKTLAAVLEKLNAPLELRELTIPSLKRGQVLVEIAYSGLCHSQLNEIKGLKGPDAYLPHTLGHEGAGVILEVGEDVTITPGLPPYENSCSRSYTEPGPKPIVESGSVYSNYFGEIE